MGHLGAEFGSEWLEKAFQSASGAIAEARATLVMHANRTAVASQANLPASFASSALQRTFTKVVLELERQSASLATGEEGAEPDLSERRRQVQEAMDLVDAAVRVFEDAESRMIKVEDARGPLGLASGPFWTRSRGSSRRPRRRRCRRTRPSPRPSTGRGPGRTPPSRRFSAPRWPAIAQRSKALKKLWTPPLKSSRCPSSARRRPPSASSCSRSCGGEAALRRPFEPLRVLRRERQRRRQ